MVVVVGGFGSEAMESHAVLFIIGRALIEQYKADNGGSPALPSTSRKHLYTASRSPLVVSCPEIQLFEMNVFADEYISYLVFGPHHSSSG